MRQLGQVVLRMAFLEIVIERELSSREHLKEDDAHGPHIRFSLAILLFFLRRVVFRRCSKVSKQQGKLSILEGAEVAQLCEANLLAIDKNILRPNIPVVESFLVHFGQGKACVSEPVEGHPIIEVIVRLLHPLAEVASIYEIKHDAVAARDILRIRKIVLVADDEGVIRFLQEFNLF